MIMFKRRQEGRVIDTEMMVARSWRRGGSVLVNCEFSAWDHEKVLEIDSGEQGCEYMLLSWPGAHPYNHSTREVLPGGSGVQGQFLLLTNLRPA